MSPVAGKGRDGVQRLALTSELGYIRKVNCVDFKGPGEKKETLAETKGRV